MENPFKLKEIYGELILSAVHYLGVNHTIIIVAIRNMLSSSFHWRLLPLSLA